MNRLDRIFGLLAVVAVVVYMLACGSRPAWSPDSNRVVFSFVDEDGDTSGLALYNLRTKQVSRIFETEGEVLFQPVWFGQEEQVIALAAKGDKELEIMEVDLSSGQSRLVRSMAVEEAVVALMIPPVLAQQRYLFFSAELKAEESEVCLYRFDLQQDELKAVSRGREHYLFHTGSDYFYIASHEKGTELGRFNIKSMRFKRFTVLDQQEYGYATAGLAAKKSGEEFAVVVKQQDEQKEDTFEVLILNGRGKIIRKIPLPKGKILDAGLHMTYGPEELTLWLPAMTPLEPDGKSRECVFSLLELDAKSGSCCEILTEHVGDDGSKCTMQPSISPDGKCLAVSVLLPKDQKSSLLYLVDLTAVDRKVTRVSLPAKLALSAETE